MKQNAENMGFMMRDLTQYIMMPHARYRRDIGTYVSYDIAAYNGLFCEITEVVPDVTTDRDLALRMCERFNRIQLAPTHMREAILDMLE